jgi:protein-S-isoprenylcysteine O-methyltransferase Ste14
LPGILLSLWALLSLRGSFSIAPEDRGVVATGTYQWLRHPMYAGEILSFLGLLVSNLTIWNLLVFCVILFLLLHRVQQEEKIIYQYEDYIEKVKWRMIPYVW